MVDIIFFFKQAPADSSHPSRPQRESWARDVISLQHLCHPPVRCLLCTFKSGINIVVCHLVHSLKCISDYKVPEKNVNPLCKSVQQLCENVHLRPDVLKGYAKPCTSYVKPCMASVTKHTEDVHIGIKIRKLRQFGISPSRYSGFLRPLCIATTLPVQGRGIQAVLISGHFSAQA